jgi:hypothetical protein
MFSYREENMKRVFAIVTFVGFVASLSPAIAGGGGGDAGRLRDPNARGLNMSVKQYNRDMRHRRARGLHPGQVRTQY